MDIPVLAGRFLARYCAANGLPLDAPPFALISAEEGHEVATGTRIGITKAAEVPWRFVRRGSPFLSKRLAES